MDILVLLSQIIVVSTPIIVPVLIALGKQAIGKVPGPLLPLVAIALGAGIDVLNAYVLGGGLGAPWGALLGATGVIVRETFKSLKETFHAA